MTVHQLNPRTQRLMAWCGPLLVISTCAGMFLAGLIPPPAPNISAERFAADLTENTNLKRTGLIIMMMGIALWAPSSALITLWVRNMEAGNYPMLAWTSAILSGCNLMIFEACPMIWAVSAYRPDEVSPEITRGLYDFAWFMFLFSWPTFAMFVWVIGIAIFRDKNAPPLLPRWIGYAAVWAGIMIIPAGLIAYFKDGPFAYNGIFAFWIPVAAFFSFICVLSILLLRLIARQEERLLAEAVSKPREDASL